MKEQIKIFKPQRIENYIVLIIAIYLMFSFLSHHIPTAICNGVRVITGILFIALLIKRFRSIPFTGHIRLLYAILVSWTIILVIRFLLEDIDSFQGVSLNQKLGNTFLSDNFLPYLLPLMLMCFGKNRVIDFQYFFFISKKFGILFLILLPLALYSMMTYNIDMSIIIGGEGSYSDFTNNSTFGIVYLLPAFIFIYFKKYLTEKNWHIYFISFLGALAIALYMARRGRSAIYLLHLTSCWLLYLTSSKGRSKIKIFIGAIFVAIIAYTIFSYTQDSFFSILVERGLEDSRSGIEDNMIADMQGWEWIIGRGLFGEYYDSSFGYYRPDIETGYLALILKGGIIYLGCFVGILLLSAYKGLFNSKSLFLKSFAIIMIITVIDLYPFGWPKFNFHYFTVWLGVYMCNKESYRKLTDTEISNIFFNNSKIA